MSRPPTGASGRFAEGTLGGAVLRILGAVGLLLLVVVVVGSLQGAEFTVAWGVVGTLGAAVVVYCAVVWRGRRVTDLGPRGVQQLDAMLAALEAERVTPVDVRTSGIDNTSLFHVRDLLEKARRDLSYGFYTSAGEAMVEVREVTRRDGWSASSPLGEHAATIGALGRDHLDRQGPLRGRGQAS
ncbi:hypothetical protein [Nocardioides euryhalodurans]|uniref:Uncharacterized protein n=1 Tax=Nocardioides euryhalodurans TaxID=2518370 RepID=A0A4P7GLU0_9ACTN|nr:hypothetical protein [Nocardioides euryhalodurans]QBR92691.1 hypothetical protein EXE57_10695 [Nocardioides euryhalodurans]